MTIHTEQKIKELEGQVETMKQINSLVNDAFALFLLGKTKFTKCLLVEKIKTKTDIKDYIIILDKFKAETEIKLKEHFNFLKD